MLENLVVKNIALIESVEIDFYDSLNVLTGETGAGKSILLDAIGLLLGDRIDKTLIRSGADDCKVVGTFSLNESSKQLFYEFCDKYELEKQDEVIITRTYSLDGKSSIKVNGEPITLTMLKELCSNLVSLYGQNDNQTIFDINNHIKILDAFAETYNKEFFKDYQNLYYQLKDIEKQLKSFGGSDADRLREIDLLEYQLNEIENANISVEDYEELENKRKLLLNAGKVISNTSLAQNYLGVETSSAIHKAKSSLVLASNYDEKLADYADRLESLSIELDDIYDSIKQYNESCDFSEAEQQKIEDRYALYTSLMRKYGQSIEEILIAKDKINEKLQILKHADEIILKLNNQKQILINCLTNLANKISEYRKENADKLCRLIVTNLQNLSMKNANLKFQFSSQDDFLYNGLDKVELLFSANLGEEVKQLSKIASGGEISRFMLALKSVIASVDNMPTMIFDEIDTGISGVTSEAVAKQMAIIAKNHQVIVVTHSQQIASMADHNYFIEKKEIEGKTTTHIKKLNYEEKVLEVARFMSGEKTSDFAIKSAENLIKEQDEYKKSLI